MKIVALSSLFPDEKNIATALYNNFFSSLKSVAEHDEVWVVFQPERFTSRSGPGRSVVDIHDFDDAVMMLREISPDCLLINTSNFMGASLNMAAKFLKIPAFRTVGFGKTFLDAPAIIRLKSMFRMLFSDKLPNDTAGKKRPLRRGGFLAYKLGFFHRTLRSTGASFFGSLAILCSEIMQITLGRPSRYYGMPDYYFVLDESSIPALIKSGADRGSIFMIKDPFHENFTASQGTYLKKMHATGPANVLVVTTAMYEHGYLSHKQSADLVTSLVCGLKKDPGIRIAFKIHPTSEDAADYVDILKDFGDSIPIYQSEDMSDIIGNFDVVVSFGPSTAQTEAIASSVRLVLLRTKPDFHAPLVDEGIRTGIVALCESPELASDAVRDCMGKDISLSDEFVARRGELFPSEKPSKRMAEIMVGVLG